MSNNLDMGIVVRQVKDPSMNDVIGKMITHINNECVLGLKFDSVKDALKRRPITVRFANHDNSAESTYRFGEGVSLGMRITQEMPSDGNVMGRVTEQPAVNPCCMSASFSLCARDDGDPNYID